MVVVRESPRAQVSPSKNTSQWPPRSPFQALLSSPSGRQKWQDYKRRNDEERSPSPSPGRNNVRSCQMLQDLAGGDDEDEDEDEETLQLQLAEIQAKLRLKKLQRSGSTRRVHREQRRSENMPPPRSASPRKLYESALPKPAIQVPLSPSTDRRTALDVSPARARLGLTANPRAADVSLKRPRDPMQTTRSKSMNELRGTKEEPPKVSSFSQRLAESKQRDEQKHAKADRLKEVRSSGFGHVRTESKESSKSGGRRLAEASQSGSASRAPTRHVRSESTISPSSSTRQAREEDHSRPPASKIWAGSAGGAENGTGHEEPEDETIPDMDDTGGSTGYDPCSKIHLKKRNIPHEVVAREMADREVYSLPRLLREVKSPDYDPPDCEADYVVFAVLASKSSPFDHAQTHRTTDKHGDDRLEAPKNKFMVLHLCDLKWEIDCFLFGTAFNHFWKLTPGTLLAIMNPAILPPKGDQHSGKFSLKLGSSEDCVMEIGSARDLGYCSAIKKNGEPCGEWIDKRKTEACEFHINLQIEKARKGRMEVNTMFNDGTGEDPPRRRRIATGRPGERSKKDPKGVKHHREYGTLYTVNGTGKSTASLLDDDDKKIYDEMIDSEASRKRIAAAQKDRDIAKQLGELGHGTGAEMMRNSKHVRTTLTTTTKVFLSSAEEAREALFSKKSAAELGLLARKSDQVSLEPAKDRKAHFGTGALSMSKSNKTNNAMGWGGAKKAGLLQPKEPPRLASPERGQTLLQRSSLVRPRSEEESSTVRSSGSQSPTKKKARFMLDKGIREPGRESLPGAAQQQAHVDSDDDDLDIV